MNPHAQPIDVLSGGLILAGLMLLASSWQALRSARRRGVLAVRGPYCFVRHPQYLAWVVIMLGLLLRWPAATALLVVAALAWSCFRLARREEARLAQEFGCAWECYAHGRPAFFPRPSRVGTALGRLFRKDRWEWTGMAPQTGPGAPAIHGRTRS